MEGLKRDSGSEANAVSAAAGEDPFGEVSGCSFTKEILRPLVSRYPLFAPCVACSLCTVFLPLFTDSFLLLAVTGLLANLTGIAAASIACGRISGRSAPDLLRRSFLHTAGMLILGAVLFLAALPGMLLATGLAREYQDLPDAALLLVLVFFGGLPALWVLFRFWPLSVLAFMSVENERAGPFRFLETSWDMTGQQGAARLATIPLVKIWVLFFAFGVFLPQILFGVHVASVVWQSVFAAGGIPALMLFTFDRGLCLYRSWRGPPLEAAMPPEVLTRNAWRKDTVRARRAAPPEPKRLPPKA